MGELRTWVVDVHGLVQGIGFRPFVQRLASAHGLEGWVRNTPDGVTAQVTAAGDALSAFLEGLRSRAPRGAVIISCRVREAAARGTSAGGGVVGSRAAGQFRIVESERTGRTGTGAGAATALVSPDLALCPECRAEMFDPGNRRFGHAFATCTACGPRFTVMMGLPYDRCNTSMRGFPMCPECEAEYRDPSDRRFHAQSVACPRCGPTLTYVSLAGRRAGAAGEGTAAVGAPSRTGALALEEARRVLAGGLIIGVKGLGGFHLVCDAMNEDAVVRLRRLKNRPHKPLAVMFNSAESMARECECLPEAAALLDSAVSPIVVLRRAPGSALTRLIAPGLDTVGAMLPYSPLHNALFGGGLEALVVTSANESGEPIVYEDEDACRILAGVADGVLGHDRAIVNPLDDSVVNCAHGRPGLGPGPGVGLGRAAGDGPNGPSTVILRRGRGLVPLPVGLPQVLPRPVLGCGADLKASFCLGRGSLGFVGPYVGDLSGEGVVDRYRDVLRRYIELFDAEPSVVACDPNPEYVSTRLIARDDWGHLPVVEVQHHHAHVAACMGENGVTGPVIGVAYDGAGHGPDGTVWGGEFILCTLDRFRRLARWEPVPLPGNELAIRQPWRMALAYLKCAGVDEPLAVLARRCPLPNLATRLLEVWDDARTVWPVTSSMGRLFDGVAALLGLAAEVTYEGQAPMLLENAAWSAVRRDGPEAFAPYEFRLGAGHPHRRSSGGEHGPEVLTIPVGDVIRCVVSDLGRDVDVCEIAARFHLTVAAITASVALELCGTTGATTVALSGGVWQNLLLTSWTCSMLNRAGMTALAHRQLSPNDECIGYGQVVVAGSGARPASVAEDGRA